MLMTRCFFLFRGGLIKLVLYLSDSNGRVCVIVIVKFSLFFLVVLVVLL